MAEARPLLRVALAQLNLLVGAIDANTDQVVTAARRARDQLGADIILFPELTLTGYPPEDLLLRQGLGGRVDQAVARLKAEVHGITLVVGLPWRTEEGLYNSALVLRDGEQLALYHKQRLPNYSVFDEVRYFISGSEPALFTCNGVKLGLTICEDVWRPESVQLAALAGAELILNLNASPYHQAKGVERERVVAQRIVESGVPLVYVNLVGGQDELVFDGGSFVMNHRGELCQRAPAFEEGLFSVDCNRLAGRVEVEAGVVEPELTPLASVYRALVMGTRDYVEKNGFPGVVLGLSGGIDSALTLAIAVDALGADRVEAVMMPSRYTADISESDAEAQANLLGVRYTTLSIEPLFQAFLASLAGEFAGTEPDITEENLQARCRGVLLMAISNKQGWMVLTTGNKSEMAVGYSTLYGDMAGGFDVLKDVPKTLVFRLAEYRNSLGAAIPQRVIDRPPSAELAPDQKDEDSLPPYAVLDAILERYVEQDQCAEEIIAAGFAPAEVERVIRLVIRNEYKRRQAPPGVRITRRAFGRDRRYPITSGYRA